MVAGGDDPQFETNLRRERQLEGIAKAKAAGVYKGRPASIAPDKVRHLKSEGMGPSAIAKQLQIGRASVYRVLAGAHGSGDLAVQISIFQDVRAGELGEPIAGASSISGAGHVFGRPSS